MIKRRPDRRPSPRRAAPPVGDSGRSRRRGGSVQTRIHILTGPHIQPYTLTHNLTPLKSLTDSLTPSQTPSSPHRPHILTGPYIHISPSLGRPSSPSHPHHSLTHYGRSLSRPIQSFPGSCALTEPHTLTEPHSLSPSKLPRLIPLQSPAHSLTPSQSHTASHPQETASYPCRVPHTASHPHRATKTASHPCRDTITASHPQWQPHTPQSHTATQPASHPYNHPCTLTPSQKTSHPQRAKQPVLSHPASPPHRHPLILTGTHIQPHSLTHNLTPLKSLTDSLTPSQTPSSLHRPHTLTGPYIQPHSLTPLKSLTDSLTPSQSLTDSLTPSQRAGFSPPTCRGYALGRAEAESLHTSKDASSRTRDEKDTRLALALERIFLPFSARRKQTSTVWISLRAGTGLPAREAGAIPAPSEAAPEAIERSLREISPAWPPREPGQQPQTTICD
ncbi:soluble scavenger receptor cysteine-rich domain-containing protein SSC5D-like [Penaeus vannamei]|uniref:soluble scavenger receptor cysteine-rich domain-containing protein SSC5D-like n=1 Tax=Penaeus vannamei TaxID=6689 RepID=UPI00387F6F74